MTHTTTLDEILAYLAGFGLDHAEHRGGARWSEVSIDAVWSRAVAQRLTGLLTAVLLDAGTRGLVSDELVERIEATAVERALLLTTLEWQLVDLLERLDRAGVAAAGVKGPVLGRVLYPHHWWRDFGDLDLLVDAADFDRAVTALTAAGAQVIVAPPSRRAATLLGKGLTFRHRLGFEIDLHHTLISGSLGFGLGWDWWMTDPSAVDIGGHPVMTTGPARTALHLLAHLCIGGPFPSMHVVRDVAQILAAIDPDEALGVALLGSVSDVGLDGLVQTGLDIATRTFRWHHPAWGAWLADHPRPRRWNEVIERFEREQRSFGAVVAASLRAHHQLRDRAAIVGAVVWPDTAHLVDRGLSRMGYAGHVAGSVLSRAS